MFADNYPKFGKRPQPEVQNAFVGIHVDKDDWGQEDYAEYSAMLARQDKQVREQTEAEGSYAYETPTLSSDVEPAIEQVVSLLELNHVVKDAPLFEDQVTGDGRLNVIAGAISQKEYIAPSRFDENYNAHRVQMTETEALAALEQFFLDLADAEREDYKNSVADYSDEDLGGAPRELSLALGDDMRENLTYIGEKELDEAAKGFAEYWKAILDTNPSRQLFVAVGAFKKSRDGMVKSGQVKSDEYIFEKVMSHITDEEKKLYAGRLVTNASEVTVTSPNDIRIILLDDWSISRRQMTYAAEYVRSELPQFVSNVEVNLIAATDQQIQRGLARERDDVLPGMATAPIPVRAYYKAHPAAINESAVSNNAHITGSHSAVDYNFATVIGITLKSLWLSEKHGQVTLPDTLHSMPLLTNIDRPY